ncbi:hypothetical protein GGX14DRAFT_380545, partial [Mycena pura]
MSTGSRCVFSSLCAAFYLLLYIRRKCNTACSIHCLAEFQPPGSPCPALLITNSAPSDAQIGEIHNFIGSVEAEISIIDDQIAQMQRTLVRLGSQRAELRDVVRSHRCVLSTIRSLPRDILGKIFSQYLGAVDSRARSPTALLPLVSVCERWRTIALSSPLLW